jgi:mannose-6-phosphate isomerase-like protein (cupin superfamily)
MEPVLRRPGEGEVIRDTARRTLRILLAHELLDVTWTRLEAGEDGADPHLHRQHADSFFVLEGEIVFALGSGLEEVRAPAGTWVSVPPGVVHGFRNNDDVRLVYLNYHAPSGGFAEYLRGRGEGFDNFDPPADGGRPLSDVVITLSDGGEEFVREDRVNVIKGELTEISAFRLSVEPAWPGIGTHGHEDQVDTFFVIEGEAGLVVGDGVVRAPAGSFYAAPPGGRHGIVNEPGQAIVFLNVHSPDVGTAAWVRG